MNDQIKKGKFVIWFYNLGVRESLASKDIFPEGLVEIKEVYDMNGYENLQKMDNLAFDEKPDLVIFDDKTLLSNSIVNILSQNDCGYARVTCRNINGDNNYTEKSSFVSDTPYVFELSDNVIDCDVIRYGEEVIEQKTRTQISVEHMIDLAQLSYISKLSKLVKKLVSNERVATNNLVSLNYKISSDVLGRVAKTLNGFISLKDHYTAGHCERVSLYSQELGKAMGFDEEQMNDLKLAADLHDIGKLALPDAIITKTSKLNDQEFDLMKKHVELSTSIFPDNFASVRKSIRAHHEKYDGEGYPDHLKGEQIPKYAQIIAIADSFDAMTSQRSYNKVKSAEEAFEDLMAHTVSKKDGGPGQFYNPELVPLFIKSIRSNKAIMDNLDLEKRKADLRTQDALEKNNTQRR